MYILYNCNIYTAPCIPAYNYSLIKYFYRTIMEIPLYIRYVKRVEVLCMTL